MKTFIIKYFVLRACAGDGFSIFLSDCGVVMSCGDNAKGCLGQRGVSSLQHPKAIEAFDGVSVQQINCGPNHVVALDSENRLYSWGYCKSGALAMGTKIPFR